MGAVWRSHRQAIPVGPGCGEPPWRGTGSGTSARGEESLPSLRAEHFRLVIGEVRRAVTAAE